MIRQRNLKKKTCTDKNNGRFHSPQPAAAIYFFYRRGLLQRCSVHVHDIVLCIVSEEIILLFKIQTFGIFPELQVWAHSRYCLSAVLLLQQLHLQFWAHSPFPEILQHICYY